jgi:S-DNA-T family DNA segregation ATPase FtsK/SpoIIIE
MAWPRMPATAALKGRAVAFGPVSGGGPAVCQLYSAGAHSGWQPDGAPGNPPAHRPFRVEALPALVPATKINAMPKANSGRATHLVIGVGGDEPVPAFARLADGGVLTVLGGPGSGKTNVIHALPLMNPEGGPWLRPEDGNDPEVFWRQSLASAAAGGLQPGTVALADDADLLPAGALQHLSGINALGYPVVLTANYSPLLLQRVPLVMKSRAAGTGVLLAPRLLSDGDLFGTRFETEANPPPGRGVLIADGVARSIQAGWAAGNQHQS